MASYEQLEHVPQSADDGTAESLTRREREVAELISEGMSNEQIAQRLVLTPGTVANHVAHILSKLRLTSRVQIAVKVANDKTRSDTGTILSLLETLRQLESTTVREAMQRAADVL